MSISLSNKYYLQAIEAYPYDLSETMESLNYALSCNSEHAGAHCLLGRLYVDQLKQFDKAEYHFEQALVSDINYVSTYELYSLMLITLKQYAKAEKLIAYAYTIKGVNLATMKHREGLLNEFCGNLITAKKLMKLAYKNSCNENERDFLENELNRVKSKLNNCKKKKRKKKKSSK